MDSVNPTEGGGGPQEVTVDPTMIEKIPTGQGTNLLVEEENLTEEEADPREEEVVPREEEAGLTETEKILTIHQGHLISVEAVQQRL